MRECKKFTKGLLKIPTKRKFLKTAKIFLTVKEELIELIKKDGKNGDQAIELMMVAKYLERIGDHAVNVCEWTKYNETGVHTKV